jgi:hypothetical protein
MRDEDRGKRLVAVFLLGTVLLNSPLIAVVEGGWLFGVPPLLLYMLAVWAGIIALLALIVERKPPR